MMYTYGPVFLIKMLALVHIIWPSDPFSALRRPAIVVYSYQKGILEIKSCPDIAKRASMQKVSTD